jgi:ABC-type multidrug transport system fused ATPase/permease subunit
MMLLAGIIAIWPTWALKVVVDVLASGKLLDSRITLNLIPQQLIQYGFHPLEVSLRPSSALNWVPLALLGLYFVDGLFRFAHIFATRFFGVLVTNEIRQQAHEKLIHLSLSQIRNHSSGDIVSRLTNDLNLVQTLFAEILATLFNDSISAIVLGIWLLVIDWKLSLLGLIILPGFFFFISKLTKRLKKLAHKGQEFMGSLASFISETVQGIDVIHLFNSEEKRQLAFEEESNKFVKVWKKQLITDGSISPFLGILSGLGIGGIIWFGLNRVFAGSITIGDFSSYMVATVLLYQPIKRLFRVNAQINQMAGTCQRVFDLLDNYDTDSILYEQPIVHPIDTTENPPPTSLVLPLNDLQVQEMTDSSLSEKYPPAPLTGGEKNKNALSHSELVSEPPSDTVSGEVLKTEGDSERVSQNRLRENVGVFRSTLDKINIEFKDVSFSYSAQDNVRENENVLKNINLQINDGDQIALIGSSGSGKSTLIKLIPRLYEVNSGEIQLNGQNTKQISLQTLRELIAFVPQDPFLFSGSLRENLLIAKPNATDQELQKSLSLAKVDFLDLIPGGLDGQISERGQSLSGGQRQRLGIARAFLKNSPLLILDEPTSSLDKQSEDLINQSLQELIKNRTVILVTHKTDSIKHFSRIIEMSNGIII